MNSRQFRLSVMDQVPPPALLVAEERLKPKPGTGQFWDNPNATRPFVMKGNPTIGALIDLILDHLQATTGSRPKAGEVLNLLVAEGLKAVAASNPQFAGLRQPLKIPEDRP